MNESAGLLFKINADSKSAETEIHRFLNVLIAETRAMGEEGAKNFGKLGNALVSLEGPAGIATIAVAGLGTAVFEVGEKMFHLAEKSAEYGNSIFEASEKTGLSAQTLSALKVQAQLVGVGFEQVQNGVTKFTLLMGDAAKGSDKAAEKLKALGVTTKDDVNQGFIQAIETIAKLPPGLEQNTAAADAFGKKFGKELIPFIKEFDGNIPALIEKLSKMGLVMNDEDAKASHEFHVQMQLLGAQFDAVSRQIGQEFLPLFRDMATEVSDWLVQNKGEVKHWADEFVSSLHSIARGFGVLETAARAYYDYQTGAQSASIQHTFNWANATINAILSIFPPLIALKTLGEQVGWLAGDAHASGQGSFNIPGLRTGGYTDKFGGGGGGKGGKGGGKSDAEERAKEEAEKQIEVEKFKLKEIEAAYKATMERLQKDFKKTGDAAAFLLGSGEADQKFKVDTNSVLDTLDAMEKKAQKNPVPSAVTLLGLEQGKRRKEVNDLITKEDEKGEKEREDAAKKHAEAVKKIHDDLTKLIIEDDKAIHDNFIKGTEEEFQTAIETNSAIIRDENSTKDQRIAAQDAIFKATVKYQSAMQKELDRVHEDTVTRLAKERDERLKTAGDTITDPEELKGVQEGITTEYQRQLDLENQIYAVQKKIFQDVPLATVAEPLKALRKAWTDLRLEMEKSVGMKNIIQSFGLASLEMFKNMEHAVGSSIEQWALYGGSIGKALKQALAAELAHLAALGAVKAIEAAAVGFLDLATGNFAGAAAAFESAGLWALLAGGAALGARALSKGNSAQSVNSSASAGPSNTSNANDPSNHFTTHMNASAYAQDQLNQKILMALSAHEDALNTFNNKFNMATPGNVVMAGAGDAGEAIFDSAVGHMERAPSATGKFARAAGWAR